MTNHIFNVSVDKVKILLEVPLITINSFLKSIAYDIRFSSIIKSNAMSKCGSSYVVTLEFGNILYIGFEPNWIVNHAERINRVVIEYNPNKINLFEELKGIETFFKHGEILSFMAIDFAYDFDIDIVDLKVIKRHGAEYNCYIGHNDLETMYFGTMGSDGMVRIYNKAKEQKHVDKNCIWTRYEIRIKGVTMKKHFFNDIREKLRLHDVYYTSEKYNNLGWQEKAILEGLISKPTLLDSIKDYKTKKKYKELIAEGMEKLELDKEKLIDAFYIYLKTVNLNNYLSKLDWKYNRYK